MVKNTTGGGNAKRQARKHQSGGENRGLIKAREGEIYAVLVEMKGGCECIVKTEENVLMSCKIGGKFRGRNKRSNNIERGSWLIVGERSWEVGRVDVVYVYNKEEEEELKGCGIRMNEKMEEENEMKFVESSIDKGEMNEIIKGNSERVCDRSAEINIDDI